MLLLGAGIEKGPVGKTGPRPFRAYGAFRPLGNGLRLALDDIGLLPFYRQYTPGWFPAVETR